VNQPHGALPRLTRAGAALSQPRVALARPVRVLQFGTGRFLRGFVGPLIDDSVRAGQFDGRALVVQSTPTGQGTAFNTQDGLYFLAAQGLSDGRPVDEARLIDAYVGSLDAASDWTSLCARARDPQLMAIVANTTESGLRLDDRDEPSRPWSYPARVASLLWQRFMEWGAQAQRGLVVLPCELVENNGDVLRDLIGSSLIAWNAPKALQDWVVRSCAFPNTLVDRIVSAPPSGDTRAQWEERIGFQDALLTIAEPYSLWAIEGDVALAERFPLLGSSSRIEISPDISRRREWKIRLLNGAHTVLAEIAACLGHESVRDTMVARPSGDFAERLVADDLARFVSGEPAAVQVYARSVLERFRNPFLDHRWIDIRGNSATKWRTRVLPVIREGEALGAVPARIAVGAAAWCWRLACERRPRMAGQQPGDQELAACVRALLGGSGAFGDELRAVPGFERATVEQLRRALRLGFPAVVASLAG
jgi:tagaturonate reductase